MILDWVFFFKAMAFFQAFELSLASVYNMIGLLFIFSNLNAVQFAVAHEVFHKLGFWNKMIGTIHMSKNLYMHFTYEHLYGHHKKVATPEDPATA
jgi:alkane 1-monooxygenase